MGSASFPWRRGVCRVAVPYLLALLIAMLLAPVAPVLAQTPPPPAPAQTQAAGGQQSVVVRGNRRIESDTILAYMDLKPGQTVTAEDLNRAVRRLFDTGLFKDVQIIPTPNQLVVQVVENPSINEIAFEGNSHLKDEDLKQIISLRPRLPFTASAAEADAQAIIDVYRRTGRYGAQVEPVIIERSDNRVDLVFQITEGPLTGVSAISFVGNQIYSDRRLRGVIQTKESGWFSFLSSNDIYDPDKLELDKELLRKYYFEHGYADFTVLSATAELAPDRSGFFITFTVSEGEQYQFGDVDVDVATKGLVPADFEPAIPQGLKGETYDASLVEKIANDMTDIAGQKGYAFVQVKPRPHKDEENRTIGITFEVTEGPRVFVQRIDIEGNTQTLDRVIRRQIEVVEGDPFDARKIREAQRRIRALDYFSKVDITTEPGDTPDRAILKVRVQEKSTGALSFGIGFSTSAGPIGNISLTERNFLGRGQLVNFQVTAAGDTQVYDFSFTEPAFLDRDLSVGMRAFFIDDNRTNTSNFRIRRLGFGPTVGFPLGEDTRLSLKYEFRRQDLNVDPIFASPYIRKDNGVRYTSSVGYALSYDQRNDPIEPTGGYLLRFSQDFAGLGGDARYVRSEGSAKTWTAFFDNSVVASLELQAGAIFGIGSDIKIDERFFLGGATFRGFADDGVGPHDVVTRDSLGGDYRAVARAEVSFPLGLPEELGIYGGLFIDAGTLWGLDDGPLIGAKGRPIDDSPHLRVGAGALLFVDTPFGPLELSFGFPVVKEDTDESEFFRLSIGTRF